MRIRELVIATALATLPLTLTACGGGATEDEFCEAYGSVAEVEQDDTDALQEAVDELAANVPDDAGDDVRDAADTLAETLPDIGAQTDAGSLDEAMENSGLGAGDTAEVVGALTTIGAYGQSTCDS